MSTFAHLFKLKIESKPTKNTVLCGDFNLPKIKWSDLKHSNNRISNAFGCFILANNFNQMVDNSTRDNAILDLILCNQKENISDVLVTETFSNFDHNKINFKINCNYKKLENKVSL